MDEMPSAQFRKGYAKLRNPTAVTVNGHVIGRWLPGAGPATSWLDRETVTVHPKEGIRVRNPFREFRPATKPGK